MGGVGRRPVARSAVQGARIQVTIITYQITAYFFRGAKKVKKDIDGTGDSCYKQRPI
jgi:hypothetical protein